MKVIVCFVKKFLNIEKYGYSEYNINEFMLLVKLVLFFIIINLYY